MPWDTILEVLQNHTVMSAAFGLWAYVVWHFGKKITSQLDQLSKRITAMNYKLSNRVTKLEAHLEPDGFTPYRNGE